MLPDSAFQHLADQSTSVPVSVQMCGKFRLEFHKQIEGSWRSVSSRFFCRSWHCHHCSKYKRKQLKEGLRELSERFGIATLYYGFVKDSRLASVKRKVNRCGGAYLHAALTGSERLFITTVDLRLSRYKDIDWREVTVEEAEELLDEFLQPKNLRLRQDGQGSRVVNHSQNFPICLYKQKEEQTKSKSARFSVLGDDTHKLTEAVIEEVHKEAGAYNVEVRDYNGQLWVFSEGADPALVIEGYRRRGFTVFVLTSSSYNINNKYLKGELVKIGTRGGAITGPMPVA